MRTDRATTIGRAKVTLAYPHRTCRFHSSSFTAGLRSTREPHARHTVGKTSISRPSATRHMVRALRCSRRSRHTQGTRSARYPMDMARRMRTRGQLTLRYRTAMVGARGVMGARPFRRIWLPRGQHTLGSITMVGTEAIPLLEVPLLRTLLIRHGRLTLHLCMALRTPKTISIHASYARHDCTTRVS